MSHLSISATHLENLSQVHIRAVVHIECTINLDPCFHTRMNIHIIGYSTCIHHPPLIQFNKFSTLLWNWMMWIVALKAAQSVAVKYTWSNVCINHLHGWSTKGSRTSIGPTEWTGHFTCKYVVCNTKLSSLTPHIFSNNRFSFILISNV